MPYRPRRARVGPLLSGIGVYVLLALHLLRFRRSLLPEEDRQQDVRGHLEELALPVLAGGLGESAARQIVAVADRRPAVFLEFPYLHTPAGHALRRPEKKEQREHDDRQRVVSPDVRHVPLVMKPSCQELSGSPPTVGALRKTCLFGG